MSDRLLNPDTERPGAELGVLVMSRSDFEGAVKQAFTEVGNPDKLAANPLARSRVVLDRADSPQPSDCGAALARLLADTVAALPGDASGSKYRRALEHTYLGPLGTQEVVAERLGVPFSTYRRHLTRGIAAAADALWELETQELALRRR